MNSPLPPNTVDDTQQLVDPVKAHNDATHTSNNKDDLKENKKLPDLPKDLTNLKERCVRMKPEVLKLLSTKIKEEILEAKECKNHTRTQELRELSWKVTDLLTCGSKEVQEMAKKSTWQQNQERQQKKYGKKKERKQQQWNASFTHGRGRRGGHRKNYYQPVSQYYSWTSQLFSFDDIVSVSSSLVNDVIKNAFNFVNPDAAQPNYKPNLKSSKRGWRGKVSWNDSCNNQHQSQLCLHDKHLDLNQYKTSHQDIENIANELVTDAINKALAKMIPTDDVSTLEKQGNYINNNEGACAIDPDYMGNKQVIDTAIHLVDNIISKSLDIVLKSSHQSPSTLTEAELLFDIMSTPAKKGTTIKSSDSQIIKIDKY